jgi:hypothetical protein
MLCRKSTSLKSQKGFVPSFDNMEAATGMRPHPGVPFSLEL